MASSSVIPARLQYQCGHAALVSLPKIKGETSAQRTARIAREKSAALARACDFCAPQMQVVVEAAAAAAEKFAAAPPSPAPVAVAASMNGEVGVVSSPEPPRADSVSTKQRTVSRPAKATRGAAAPTSTAEQPGRFTVSYRVERVIQARDISDALRQLEALGAADILAISRETR